MWTLFVDVFPAVDRSGKVFHDIPNGKDLPQQAFRLYAILPNNHFSGKPVLWFKEGSYPLYKHLRSVFDRPSQRHAHVADVIDHLIGRSGLNIFPHYGNLHLPFVYLFNIEGLRLLLRYTAYFGDSSLCCLQAQHYANQQNYQHSGQFECHIHVSSHLFAGSSATGLATFSALKK